MSRILITAEFPDGTSIDRSTEHAYSHAWRVRYTRRAGVSDYNCGFSHDAERARKAAEAFAKKISAQPAVVIQGIDIVEVQS